MSGDKKACLVGLVRKIAKGTMSRLTLGVVGHRSLTHKDNIQKGVERASSRLLIAFPHGSLRLLCSLAEGADRLVTRIILEKEPVSLWVPLPMPQEEYVRDFTTMSSKEEFLELLGRASRVVNVRMTGGRDQVYLDAGRYILNHSDVLLVVWDGGPIESPGDTAQIVLEARQRSLPIAWVHAGTSSTRVEAGVVSYENFPERG